MIKCLHCLPKFGINSGAYRLLSFSNVPFTKDYQIETIGYCYHSLYMITNASFKIGHSSVTHSVQLEKYLVIPKSASLTTLVELTRQFLHAISLWTYFSSFRYERPLATSKAIEVSRRLETSSISSRSRSLTR